MLVYKIWTVAVAIDEAHLPEFTYRYQFTLIIITSFYFLNVTAYQLFIVHEVVDKNMTFPMRFPLNRHFACQASVRCAHSFKGGGGEGVRQLMGVARKKYTLAERITPILSAGSSLIALYTSRKNVNCQRNSIKVMQEFLTSKYNKLLSFRHEEFIILDPWESTTVT